MTAEAHVISPDLKAMQMTIELPKMAIELPLDDNGIVQAATHSKPPPTGWSRLFLIPLLMATLFTGAVIGMYFQPPGLRVFFNATGLEPGAGTHTPIALAIAQVEAQEQIAMVSEGDIVALGRIIPFGDVSRVESVPFLLCYHFYNWYLLPRLIPSTRPNGEGGGMINQRRKEG